MEEFVVASKSRKANKIAPTPTAQEDEHDGGCGGLLLLAPVAAGAYSYCSSAPVRLTVWCKSLLFNGDGYTVYDDADGRMVFRVDNYAHDWRRETVLMDFAGNVLLTIRRRRPMMLNLRESWEAYQGDDDKRSSTTVDDNEEEEEEEEDRRRRRRQRRPVFKATKELGGHGCSVSVISGGGGGHCPGLDYRMNWSHQKDQSSMIYRRAASTALVVAEVSRKYGSVKKNNNKLVDKDVLTLRLQPGMDQALAMALLMITDSMRSS